MIYVLPLCVNEEFFDRLRKRHAVALLLCSTPCLGDYSSSISAVPRSQLTLWLEWPRELIFQNQSI